jgi:large subunit ribosomal protein L25
MQHLKLNTQTRIITGNQVRKLRKDGFIPAVIFGKKYSSKNIQLPLNTFLKLYRQAGKTNIIDISIDEKEVVSCLINDLDLDPVKDIVRHVNFLAIDLSSKIDTLVPLKIVGNSPAVKNYGAILIQNLQEIEIRVLPENIPPFVEVDVTSLKDLNDVIHASDISNTNFEVITDPEETIVSLSVIKETADDSSDEIQTEILTGSESQKTQTENSK